VVLVSAAVLRQLRRSAEDRLEDAVTDAVVTVPAHFSNEQRQATLLAAAIAGINVLRLVPEPTAAAIAFGFRPEAASSGAENLLVFDFGGGTLDVSCIRHEGRSFEIRAVHGDPFLGGADIDRLLAQYLEDRFVRVGGAVTSDSSKRLRATFSSHATSAKHRLSTARRTKVTIPGILGGDPFETVVVLPEFEALLKPLMKRCKAVLLAALAEAAWSVEEVDRVLLVGGSSRIPAVRSMLTAVFGRPPSKLLNPDEAVAEGAAVWAEQLVEERSGGYDAQSWTRIRDVTPSSIGIEVLDGECRASRGHSEITRRVLAAGGSDGELRVSLSWESDTDLDLHVRSPLRETVRFSAKTCPSGGELDVDMNVDRPYSDTPVENAVWRRHPPAGRYVVSVVNYRSRSGVESEPFELEIKNGAHVTVISGLSGRTTPFHHTFRFSGVSSAGETQKPCERITVPLVPANTAIPTNDSMPYTVYTARPGQSSATIKIVEGEARLARDNSVLGELKVRGIRSEPGKQGQLQVMFGVDANGILTVVANDTASSAGASLELTTSSGDVPEADIRKMRAFLDCLADERSAPSPRTEL